jgi:hypothetical protein
MNIIDIKPIDTTKSDYHGIRKEVVCIPSEIADKLSRAGLSKNMFLVYSKVRPLLTVGDMRTWFAINDLAIFPNSMFTISENTLLSHFMNHEELSEQDYSELKRDIYPDNPTALLTPYFNNYAFNSITYSVDIEAEIFVTPTGILVSVPSGYFSYLAKVSSAKVTLITNLVKKAHQLFSIEEVTKFKWFSLYVSYLKP